jgi:hypothetical protein
MKTTPEHVIASIEAIPGNKIVTIFSPNSMVQTMHIDVDENNEWGYDESHKALFTAKVMSAIHSKYGNVLVRQFLPTISHTLENGTPIPNKNVYGMIFKNGKVQPIAPNDLALACESEDGVSYQDISPFLGAARQFG